MMESFTKPDQTSSPQITGGSIDRGMASLSISPEIGNAIRRERETYALHYAVRPSTVGGPVGYSTLKPTSTKAATPNGENGQGFLPTVNPKVQYGSLNRTKIKQIDASPFYRTLTTIDYPKHSLNIKSKIQTKENKDGIITDHRIRQLSNEESDHRIRHSSNEESVQPQSTYEFIRPTQRFWYPSIREQKHIWIEQSSAKTGEATTKEPDRVSNGKSIEHPKTLNRSDDRNSQIKEHNRTDSLSKVSRDNLDKGGELRTLIDGPVDDDAVFEVQKKPILKPSFGYDNSLQRRNGIKYSNANTEIHDVTNYATRTLERQTSGDKTSVNFKQSSTISKSDSFASTRGTDGSIGNKSENDHLQYITVSRTMFPYTKPNNISPVNTNHIRYAHLKSEISKHECRWRSDGSASTYSDGSGSSDNSDKARKRSVRFSVSDIVHEFKSGDPVK